MVERATLLPHIMHAMNFDCSMAVLISYCIVENHTTKRPCYALLIHTLHKAASCSSSMVVVNKYLTVFFHKTLQAYHNNGLREYTLNFILVIVFIKLFRLGKSNFFR